MFIFSQNLKPIIIYIHYLINEIYKVAVDISRHKYTIVM